VKILHTAQSYAPEVCGVREVVQQISEGLVKCGHDVTVATAFHPDRNFEKLNGVKIKQFDIKGQSIIGFKGEVKEYKEFICNFTCDIMMNYAAQQWASDLVYPLLKRLPFKKVFAPCGYSTLYNWKWKPYFWRLPAVLRKYDHIIYHSDNYRDKKFGDKHNIQNFSVIGNGTSDREFQEPKKGFRSEYGINTSHMLLCVSNFSPGKNQEMVLNAYQKASMPDSTLVFIGSEFNEHSKRLQTLWKCQNGNVRYLASVPREKVISAYHEADLFLFGSVVECFPLVILEAMASRTPFISNDVGCVAQLPGGIIVNSVEEMAMAIRRLANKGSQWRHLARIGRKTWEIEYRWEKIIDQYESLYIRLCKEQPLEH
jgi:glycosyltransferase involved in cell wall biosynthesis